MDLHSNTSHKPTETTPLTVESWSQGLMVGALLVMIFITISNMRKGSLLHKLILAELVIALPDGFFIFGQGAAFGWFLSSTSALMIISWTLHNIIAWIKNKPFLSRSSTWIYISTVILVQPYWILEIYANFSYFNNINSTLFKRTRPFEALCRDPWWIFTTVNLIWNIKYRYDFKILELIKVSHRFGIMLLSMALSIAFIVVDILAVTPVLRIGGLNPFWKISFIFKCFTDTIILDDFKTCLDKLSAYKRAQLQMEQHGRIDPIERSRVGDRGFSAAGDDLELQKQERSIHVETELHIVPEEIPTVAPSSSSTSELVNPDDNPTRGTGYGRCYV